MIILRCLAFLMIAAALPAASLWDSGDPTPAEQLVLEMVNRARADPAAEGTRLGISITEGLSPGDAALVGPRAPLAMNRLLLQIARAHSQDEWTRNYFNHNTLEGLTPFMRMTAAGYSYTSAGENIAIGSSHSASALEDVLMVDTYVVGRGHRTNLLDIGVAYREVGIGSYHNANVNGNGFRDFLTQDFGSSAAGPFLVGVVYADADSDGFYDIGEGLGGVLVSPDSGGYCALTGQAGGYAFPVGSSGNLSVTFSGGGLAGTIVKNVALGSGNRKLDARASEAVAGGGSAPATPASAATVSDATSSLPTLGGSTEADATVTIFDGATAIGVATADSGGDWTWTPIIPLAAGSHSLTWKASNSSGTSGASPATLVRVSGGGGGGGSAVSPSGSGGCGAGVATAGLLLALLCVDRRRRGQRFRTRR